MSDTTRTLSDTDRAALVAAIEAAGVESPEEVMDWAIEAAEQGGLEAGLAEIAAAKAREAN